MKINSITELSVKAKIIIASAGAALLIALLVIGGFVWYRPYSQIRNLKNTALGIDTTRSISSVLNERLDNLEWKYYPEKGLMEPFIKVSGVWKTDQYAKIREQIKRVEDLFSSNEARLDSKVDIDRRAAKMKGRSYFLDPKLRKVKNDLQSYRAFFQGIKKEMYYLLPDKGDVVEMKFRFLPKESFQFYDGEIRTPTGKSKIYKGMIASTSSYTFTIDFFLEMIYQVGKGSLQETEQNLRSLENQLAELYENQKKIL